MDGWINRYTDEGKGAGRGPTGVRTTVRKDSILDTTTPGGFFIKKTYNSFRGFSPIAESASESDFKFVELAQQVPS